MRDSTIQALIKSCYDPTRKGYHWNMLAFIFAKLVLQVNDILGIAIKMSVNVITDKF